MSFLGYLFLIISILSCSARQTKEAGECKVINTAAYTLIIPEQQEALLVLFPGFGGNAASIESESSIVAEAVKENAAVMLMNFNQRLLLSAEEKESLGLLLQQAIEEHGLRRDRLFLGGMSSGGNVALLMGAYLQATKPEKVQPKGIFVVDAPVDVSSLYHASSRIAARNFHAPAITEANFLLNYLQTSLGHPTEQQEAYMAASPYTQAAEGKSPVVQALVHTPLRFYTEPDLEWHCQHRGNSYEDLNALSLKNMYQALLEAGSTTAEYLETKERGYRADGERHPHSWSIVDEKELLPWMQRYY